MNKEKKEEIKKLYKNKNIINSNIQFYFCFSDEEQEEIEKN